jgi:uncharacterized protein involved in copper resistance
MRTIDSQHEKTHEQQTDWNLREHRIDPRNASKEQREAAEASYRYGQEIKQQIIQNGGKK